jgi:hypothetical protein
MKHLLPGYFLFACLLMAVFSGFSQSAKPVAPGYEVKHSELFSGVQLLGEEIPYGDTSKKGDTFPLTWAGDNNIYSSVALG